MSKKIANKLNEEISAPKAGYIVVPKNKTGYGKTFTFSEYKKDHKALESAIMFAKENDGIVRALLMGEIVWENDIKSSLNENSQNMIKVCEGSDYTTISGLNNRCKECGCATTLGYNQGRHTISTSPDNLSLIVSVLENGCDELSGIIAERLKRKYLKK